MSSEPVPRVAQRYLDPAKMVTVIVGDKASLEPMLAPASN
jgi:predicted Zn-dependent peptidase